MLTAADFVHPGERPLHGRTTEAETASAASSGFRARKERNVVRAAGAVVGVTRDVKVGRCRGFRGALPISADFWPRVVRSLLACSDTGLMQLQCTHRGAG